jgi:hypothetical protein
MRSLVVQGRLVVARSGAWELMLQRFDLMRRLEVAMA